MEFARRWLAQIQAQLSDLSVSAKMLIGTLAFMLPLLLWVVVQYAMTPQMVALLDQPIEAQARYQITAALDDRGIAYRTMGDRVLVPRGEHANLLAELQMLQVLPEDTTRGFDALVERQTWWQSSEQNRQMMMITKQNVLSNVVRAYPSVHDATVIISMPREQGFGRTHREPTASVNVMLSGGQRLDQRKVDAIAGLVAGAVAELKPENVTVIDAAAGQQWTIRKEGEVIPGDYLELLHAQEGYYRNKLAETLRYIPEVIVAVNVNVDVTRKETDQTRYDQDSSLELLTMERRETTRSESADTGAEPGVRANAGADIAGGGGGGTLSTTETTESGFSPFAGRTHEVSATPGGIPTRISATINVPRSFFVDLYMQDQEEDAPLPTDEVLEALIAEHTDRIRRQVEPLVLAQDAGEVVVDVYPDARPRMEMDAAQAGAGGLLADGYAKPIGLGALALVSLSMMLLMVRKASQKPPTPSIQELAGVPPRIETEIDMVGEVDESDSVLDGMELDDDTLRQRKISEQVSEMIKANPSDVARIMNRWAKADG
ncbi:MAG: hypothetical protein WD294_08975 [Phycisphaeraceae bacterium]